MLSKEEYALLIQDAIQRNESIVIGANCSVTYSGRAESFLDFGDRIIIIKADNTLLIHQPVGNNPINYMKPNTGHSVSLHEGQLTLKSRNLPQKEYMDIIMKQIYFFNSHKMEDAKEILINGTEKDMSDMLFSSPDLIEPGFTPLSREEHTQFGFIDLFGFDRNNILTIVECKRYTADFKAVEQLDRYVQKIKRSKGIVHARGILAAPKISPNARVLLEQKGYEFREINPPKRLERFNRDQASLHQFK
ncbi:endonuclease NucS [Candidatus Woesearchaeota archaeon]|nr:endonuclease NucS [Candidatus Woesearchaeota archaeon]